MPDITAEDGAKITAEAKNWKGTPYETCGAATVKGVKGDCSGTTNKIYIAAGFPYDFQATATFVAYATSSGLFRKLAANEASQDGDVLYWSGHVAIYCTFSLDSVNATTACTSKTGSKYTRKNDMWSASHPDGPAYEAHKISYFKGGVMPDVYRYQKK